MHCCFQNSRLGPERAQPGAPGGEAAARRRGVLCRARAGRARADAETNAARGLTCLTTAGHTQARVPSVCPQVTAAARWEGGSRPVTQGRGSSCSSGLSPHTGSSERVIGVGVGEAGRRPCSAARARLDVRRGSGRPRPALLRSCLLRPFQGGAASLSDFLAAAAAAWGTDWLFILLATMPPLPHPHRRHHTRSGATGRGRVSAHPGCLRAPRSNGNRAEPRPLVKLSIFKAKLPAVGETDPCRGVRGQFWFRRILSDLSGCTAAWVAPVSVTSSLVLDAAPPPALEGRAPNTIRSRGDDARTGHRCRLRTLASGLC